MKVCSLVLQVFFILSFFVISNNIKIIYYLCSFVSSFQYTSMKTVGVKAVDDTFKVSLHERGF